MPKKTEKKINTNKKKSIKVSKQKSPKEKVLKQKNQVSEVKTKIKILNKQIEKFQKDEAIEKKQLRKQSITAEKYDKKYKTLNSKYAGQIENAVDEREILEDKLNTITREMGIKKSKSSKRSATVMAIARANNRPQKGSIDNPLENKKNIIEIRHVKKFYTTRRIAIEILKDVSVEIERGDFCILYGKSGSGKSTLLNLISGLDRVTEGEIVINNKDVSRMNDRKSTKFRRKTMGFIFQRYNLLPNLTAYENVETGAFLQKDKSKRLDIKELFETMDIADAMYKYPSELSGGQQQRISIARALVKNPDILFADEPTGALDDKMSAIVMKILQDINKKYGTTIVMVSHNPAAKKVANKSITLKSGRIHSVYKNRNIKSAMNVKW